nr:thioredoxin peroxidase [Hymenolepis microstoma]
MKTRALISLTWGFLAHQISQLQETCGAPGVSVCVSVCGTTVYSKGFGFADVEQGVKVTPQTKFRIASISKSFTSLLVGRMIDQNRINLDEDVKSYLDDFCPKTKDGKAVSVTMRQLLNHTSGIRHYNMPEEHQKQVKHYESARDSLAIFKNDPFVHSPGEDYLYSTYGFTVVSAVIEAIIAKTQPVVPLFERPVRLKPLSNEKGKKNLPDETKIDSLLLQLFDFLGLQNTCLDEPFKIIPFRARICNLLRGCGTCHRMNAQRDLKVRLFNFTYGLSARTQSMANHLADIYLGQQPLENARIVSRDTLVDYLWRPNKGTVQGHWIPGGLYGLGWFVARRSTIPADFDFKQIPVDRIYVGHTGAAVGFTSILLMSLPIVTGTESPVVSQQLPPICVAVLVNLESASGIGKLGIQIVETVTEAFMSSLPSDKNDAHTFDSKNLSVLFFSTKLRTEDSAYRAIVMMQRLMSCLYSQSSASIRLLSAAQSRYFSAKVTRKAPNFAGTAVVNGQFKDIGLHDFIGKYLVLFFYPLDFTFVCPTELIAFSDRIEEFNKIDCNVVGVSTDSHFSHLSWINMSRKAGGLGGLNYPLLADYKKEISRDYDVLLEDKGVALRGLFIIDQNGVIRNMTVNDLPVGRSVDETLRLVKAFQFVDQHGEVCPANWTPEKPAMKASIEGAKEYFEKVN